MPWKEQRILHTDLPEKQRLPKEWSESRVLSLFPDSQPPQVNDGLTFGLTASEVGQLLNRRLTFCSEKRSGSAFWAAFP